MERVRIQILRIVLLWGLLAPSVCLAQDRECVVDRAHTYVGVKEATGRNDGPIVEKFLALTGFKAGAYWCAAFNSYVYNECGVEGAPISAWSPDWGKKKDAVYEHGQGYSFGRTVAKPGDIFTKYYSSKGRIAHTGIYIYSTPSRVYTIEGNAAAGSSSRNGDGVYIKSRSWSEIYRITNYIDR